jgi:exonuclease VII small subunit
VPDNNRTVSKLKLCWECYKEPKVREWARKQLGIEPPTRKKKAAKKKTTKKDDPHASLNETIDELDEVTKELEAATTELASESVNLLDRSRAYVEELRQRIIQAQSAVREAERRFREANAEARRTVKLTTEVTGRVQSLNRVIPKMDAEKKREKTKGK